MVADNGRFRCVGLLKGRLDGQTSRLFWSHVGSSDEDHARYPKKPYDSARF
jgi:hypothetical protein